MSAAKHVAKKWTKADIKRLVGILDGFYVTNRPLGCFGASGVDDFNVRFQTYLNAEGQRKRVLVDGLKVRITTFERSAKENADTAHHFSTHPTIYGDSTSEMVERFNGYANEARRKACKFRALLTRVESEGLPPEVLTYDPTVNHAR